MKRRIVLAAVAIVLLFTAIKVGPTVIAADHTFSAELPDAAGIRPGDGVRIAGISVGSVTGLEAVKDRVVVTFKIKHDIALPADTRTEVKLASLLGQRYLNLTPGSARAVAAGSRLPLTNADGTYTLEHLWVDNSQTLTGIDNKTLSSAINVLTNDLSMDPGSTQAALKGMTAVADLVSTRDDQITALIKATREISDQAESQKAQLATLITNADQVFAMIVERKNAIDTLLRDSRALVERLSAMAKRNQAPVHAALADLHKILGTLRKNKAALARTLEVAEPALRLYVNGGGDGPWLGVNAPYFVFPDSLWCLTRRDIGCK